MGAAETFNFDESFQRKIAALCLRDPVFFRQTNGLIKPEYFESNATGFVVDQVQIHFEKYDQLPDRLSFAQILDDSFSQRKVRKDMEPEIKAEYLTLMKYDVSNPDYVADKIVPFSRAQAMETALYEGALLMEKVKQGHMEYVQQIKDKMAAVCQIGLNEDLDSGDYLENAIKRQQYREDLRTGKVKPRGIPFGIKLLDERLLHGGLGRKEQTLILGKEKSGKSAFCGEFMKRAFLGGYNGLGVTLEVSADIYNDRLDSNITQINMMDLVNENGEVYQALQDIKSLKENLGVLKIHEFPTDSFTPAALVRLIERYRSKGIIFDYLVIDSLDLMAADSGEKDSIDKSREVYGATRGIAQIYDLALLSPTQLNREGGKSLVGESNQVGTDISRTQICDLALSINRTEEEQSLDQFRLYWAASRNQKGSYTIKFKSDMARMAMMTKVIDIDGMPI